MIFSLALTFPIVPLTQSTLINYRVLSNIGRITPAHKLPLVCIDSGQNSFILLRMTWWTCSSSSTVIFFPLPRTGQSHQPSLCFNGNSVVSTFAPTLGHYIQNNPPPKWLLALHSQYCLFQSPSLIVFSCHPPAPFHASFALFNISTLP